MRSFLAARKLAFIIGGCALGTAQSALAATDYAWNSASASGWSTGGNWSPAGGPPTSADNVVTPTAFGKANLGGGTTTINNLTYNSATGWAIEANSGSATSLAINGTLTKSGAGVLTIKGATSASPLSVTIGAITINPSGGSIGFGGDSSLSSLTVTGNTVAARPLSFILVNNGTANFAAVTANDEFNIGGGSNAVTNTTVTSLSGSGIVQVGDGGNSGAVSTLTINSASDTTSTYSGKIRTNNRSVASFGINTLHLVKSGAGTQVLSGTATSGSGSYTGNTTIDGGTLKIASNVALGFGGVYAVGKDVGRTFVSGGSTLDLAGNMTVNEQIELTTGNLLNSASGTTATLDNGLAGIRLNTGGSGPTRYSGTATVTIAGGGGGAGAAASAAFTALPDGTVGGIQLTAGGSGYTSAPTVTVTGSTSNASTPATFTATLSSLTLNSTGNKIGGDGNLVINAAISGATGVFEKVGGGVVTLNGTNLYGGATTVSAGTLRLGASGTLASAGGTVTVNGAGKLDTSVASVSMDRALTVAAGGTLDPNQSGIGTIALGTNRNFTMSGGTVQLKLGTTFDQITSAGGTALFSITGGTFALDVTDASFSYDNTYQVLSGFGGSSSVSGLAISGFDTAQYTAALSSTGVLSFSVIPEPTSGAVLGLVVCLGLARRRRSVPRV